MSAPCSKGGTTPQVKICPACRRTFECSLGGCWCAEVPLDANALRAIQDEFLDCLCPKCLAARVESAD